MWTIVDASHTRLYASRHPALWASASQPCVCVCSRPPLGLAVVSATRPFTQRKAPRGRTYTLIIASRFGIVETCHDPTPIVPIPALLLMASATPRSGSPPPPGPRPIRRLQESVINRIAAGEVGVTAVLLCIYAYANAFRKDR